MDFFQPPDPYSVFFKDSLKYLSQEEMNRRFHQYQQANQNNYNFQNARPFNVPQQAVPQIPPNRILESTPNVVGSLICSIVSLLFSIAWLSWYGTAIGILTGCLGIYLTNSGLQMLRTSPDVFSQSGFGTLKTAKTLSLISLIISGIWFIGMIIYFMAVSSSAY
jgi:hypothetical protein